MSDTILATYAPTYDLAVLLILKSDSDRVSVRMAISYKKTEYRILLDEYKTAYYSIFNGISVGLSRNYRLWTVHHSVLSEIFR